MSNGFTGKVCECLRRMQDYIEVEKNICPCGYIYDPAVGDPDGGIAPGTKWEDISEDWVCPVSGLGKEAFTAE